MDINSSIKLITQLFMKGNFKLVFADKITRISIIVSIVLVVIQTFLVLVFYSKLPPLIPFFNSRPWGEERLASSQAVFLLPVFSLVIFVINIILSAIFYKKNVLISRIIAFTILLFTFLSLISFIQILFLVS
jgi:hypothetical protein